jgi:hypothetical protein
MRTSNLIKDQDLWTWHLEKQVIGNGNWDWRVHNDAIIWHGQMLRIKQTMDVNNQFKPNLLLLYFDSLPSLPCFEII